MRLARLILAVGFILALVGCSQTQQAEKYRDLADSSLDLGETITRVLNDYPAGEYEGNALLDALTAALPEKWQTEVNRYIALAGDVRAGATAAALAAADAAENFEARAVQAEEQAAKQAGWWSDAIATATNIGQAFMGPGGVVAGIGGIIAAVQRRKRREAETAAASIVRAIDAGRKADPDLDAAFKGDGGAAVNVILEARGVKDRVQAIRNTNRPVNG